MKDSHKITSKSGDNNSFRASVIVGTYNRSRRLAQTLRALAVQTAGPTIFEVVVVNDGSTDETEAVCASMRLSLPNMRYLAFEHNKGSNIALSEGIRISRGDYLLFTDDDCIPHFDWVNQMIAALDRAAIVAGMIVSPTSGFLKLCHNISEFHLFFPGNQSRFVDFIAGANMGFRRNVYDVIGGLSKTERLAHDMDMILRARARGYRICRARESFVLHDPDRNSLRTIFRYTSKHAENTIVLRNLYRRTLKTPFVLRSPLLILLASPIIAFWVTLGIYLRNPLNLALWKTIPIVGALKLTWCWGAAYGLSRFSCRDSSRGENGR